jgi:hypothetical protein
MYSFQGQNYTSLKEVPGDILSAFIQNNVLTETIAIQQNKILFCVFYVWKFLCHLL